MITVVSHDAGGAELISSWILRNNMNFIPVLDGPAIKIFDRKFDKINLVNLKDALLIQIGYFVGLVEQI